MNRVKGLLLLLMAMAGASAFAAEGPRDRDAPVLPPGGVEVVPWPQGEAPKGFMSRVTLARLRPDALAIILLSAGGDGAERKGPAELKSAREACEYLNRQLNMAHPPEHVSEYRTKGRPPWYVFCGGTTAYAVRDFSKGAALSASGQIASYEVSWPFFRLLHAALSVEGERFEVLKGKINWALLEKELARVTDAEQQRRHRDCLELWQAIVDLRDFGMKCARPCVFEWKLRLLLKGDGELERSIRGFKKPAWDPKAFRRYLMATELPPWGHTIRYVAAGVLAGEGDEEAMDVLTAWYRTRPGAYRARTDNYEPFQMAWGDLYEVFVGAHTEKALPLWEKLLKDEDEDLRRWAIENVHEVPSEKAIPLLVSGLRDTSYPVRRAAALRLMGRNGRDAAPVLREILQKELRDGLASALALAPICCKLEEWKVPDVPWTALEGHLNDKATKGDTIYCMTISLAGHCVSAGRNTVALPFLKRAMQGKNESVALHAARTLLRSGSPAGIERLAQRMATLEGSWSDAYEDLQIVALFLSRGAPAAEERAAAMGIARTAYERRKAIFRASFFRLFEALGEMGALCRVGRKGEALVVAEAIEIPYASGDITHWAEVVALHKARRRSIEVSARQEGITLPPGWLEKFEQAQLAALSELARTGPPAVADQAAAALRSLQAPSSE